MSRISAATLVTTASADSSLSKMREKWSEDLFDGVIPFWEKNSLDQTHGGDHHSELDRHTCSLIGWGRGGV